MKRLILCLILLSCRFGMSQIIDKNNYLEKVDAFLGNPKFETSYRVGDLAKFEEKNCADKETCVTREVSMEVLSASAERATLRTWAGDKERTRSVFEALRGSDARRIAMVSNGDVIIETFRNVTFQWKAVSIPAVEVTMSQDVLGFKIRNRLVITRLRGIAQMVVWETSEDTYTSTLTLKSFKEG